MSIYAGNFKDGAGVPFDPHSYARAGTGAAQVMQRRYFSHSNITWKLPHIAALRQLRDIWHKELTNQQRTDWLAIGSDVARARDYVFDTRDRAFLCFAMANFAVLVLDDGNLAPLASFEGVTCVAAIIDTINTGAQTITVHTDYDEWPLPDEPGTTWLYQIDPTRTASTRLQRFTRLITAYTEWDHVNPTQIITGPMPWPFASGDELYLLVRHQLVSIFQPGIVLHDTAP